MISVPNVEREMFGRLRREMSGREPCCDEKAVRVRMQIGTVDPGVGVVHELRHGQIVEHRRERMKIALEAGFRGPPVKRDSALVRRVTFGHPFGFFYPQAVEEAAQRGSGTFTHTDDAHGRRFDHGDFHSLLDKRAREYQRRHPSGRTAPHYDNSTHGRRQRRAASEVACRIGGAAVIESGRIGHNMRRTGSPQLSAPATSTWTLSAAERAIPRMPSLLKADSSTLSGRAMRNSNRPANVPNSTT